MRKHNIGEKEKVGVFSVTRCVRCFARFLLVRAGLAVLFAGAFFSGEAYSSEAYAGKRFAGNRISASSVSWPRVELAAAPAPVSERLSPEAALQIATALVPGRVLRVAQKQLGERAFYQVKILAAQGHVVVVMVDVITGEVLPQ